MSKVTITIDDTNSALVAAFGENSLETIADQMGYMTEVEKNESELPKKIKINAPDGIEYFGYPEGTEMYKPNPQSKAQFVAEKILVENIVPRLLAGFSAKKQAEKNEEARIEVKQAEEILTSVAIVETT